MLIFGEPYETSNDAVIITVARAVWRGRLAQPVGIFTVRTGGTTWTSAQDSSRHALIAALTGFAAAVIGTLAILRRPPWPDMTERVMQSRFGGGPR